MFSILASQVIDQASTQPAESLAPWDSVLGPHIYVFYVAFLVSFIFTPIMRQIALFYGIIDQPDGLRKIHKSPVAYLGGIAVFLGWVAGLAISQFHVIQTDTGPHHLKIKICIVVGAGATVALGLYDDLRRLRPRYKLMGQVAAALLLLSQDVGIKLLDPLAAPLNARILELFGPHLLIPQVVITFASRIAVILIVVGCCNATNLMDGLDGLCGGVTAVIAAGFLVLAVSITTRGVMSELNPIRIVLALALLGAVLGFVPFNFNPASIFMGDAGSMFLGYACATMIILLAQEQSKWFLAAMVMFAVPVLDTSLAFARRWVNRRPLFSADRHHFHHQLVARGLSVRKTVIISYALAVGFCVLGGLIVYLRTRYAIAIYLVVFGSIIVAAYKMGMIHETVRSVERQPLGSKAVARSQGFSIEPTSVLEIREPAPLGSTNVVRADHSGS